MKRESAEQGSKEAFIIESILGILAFNSKNEVVEKSLFPADPDRITQALIELERGKTIAEVREVLKKLSQRGFRIFTFENRELARTVEEEMHMETRFEERTAAGDLLRNRLTEMAVEMEVVESREEVYALLHEVTMRMAKERVAEEFEETEHMIVQAVQILEELDKAINVLSMKAREWYGIHFPELNRLIGDHETYMRLVVELGERGNFTRERLEELGVSSPLSIRILERVSRSLGTQLRMEDLETIRRVCGEVLSLNDLRRGVGDYVASLTGKLAPNTVEVAGPLLTAKLIARAGSLKKLAVMPSSKIQVLGAEKAMFRAIKTGAKGPKHGLIFQHPFIHSASRKQRGKFARALAGKLTIAARVDAFSRRFIGDKLKEELEERIRQLKKSGDKISM